MLGQRVVLRGLEKLAGEDGRRIVLEPVEHTGLQRGVDLAEGERGRRRAHQAQAFGDDRIGQRPDLQAGEVLRRLHRLLREHAARAEIIGPGDDADAGALEQGILDRLCRAAFERPGLLREACKEIAEVEGADQRHQIRRDRGARHHEVDDPELHRVDDVDLLTELIVGKKGDVDLLGKPVGFEVLDQIVVIDAAVGVFGIVRQRRRALELQRRSLCAADDCGCCGKPCCGHRRRFHEHATADVRDGHGAFLPDAFLSDRARRRDRLLFDCRAKEKVQARVAGCEGPIQLRYGSMPMSHRS